MKTRLPFAVLLLPVLLSCATPRPEIPMTEAPAAPLVQELDRRRGSFSGLKAVARVQSERRGRKRVYESVAVLLQGQAKFRIEGYGLLAETVFAAVWNGRELHVRMPGEASFVRTGPWAFERLLGFTFAPAELAAVLSGNIPPIPAGGQTRAGCSQDGRCIVDIRTDDGFWRARIAKAEPFQIEAGERYRSDELLYRVRFDNQEPVGGYLLPKRIAIESADRNALITIEYQDVEVNVPVEDGVFQLSGAEVVR